MPGSLPHHCALQQVRSGKFSAVYSRFLRGRSCISVAAGTDGDVHPAPDLAQVRAFSLLARPGNSRRAAQIAVAAPPPAR
jgi:hypothetical protein